MKLAASITDSDTTTIIIDLTKEEFSDLAEIAPVRSLFKNGYWSKLTSYIPVSILNSFLKNMKDLCVLN